MFTDNQKISTRQLQSLIIADFSGIFMILIPLFLFGTSSEGAVSGVIMSFGVGSVMVFVASKIALKQSKRKNLIILKTLYVFLLIKTFIVNGIYLKLSQDAISVFLFNSEYKALVAVVMVLFGFYMCKDGLEARARLSEVVVIFIIIFSAMAISLVFTQCDIREIKDCLLLNTESFKKEFYIITLFCGCECLFFIMPKVRGNKKYIPLRLAGVFALLGVIVILLVCEAVCLFGKDVVSMKMWPVLEMMSSIHFPGLLLERQDVLFMGMYLTGISMFASFTVYYTKFYIRQIFPKIGIKKAVLISALLVFISIIVFDDNMIKTVLNISMCLNIIAVFCTFLYFCIWGEV